MTEKTSAEKHHKLVRVARICITGFAKQQNFVW